MGGPLEGVKILEFSEIIAAPFAGMLLSDMGADVIKIEPPWGEPWRHTRPFAPNESKTYIALNRGKRSLPLNLTMGKARDIIYQMMPNIDVVLINARPDVPEKLGIDYLTLSRINPQLIYCDNTAFGRKGPHSDRPGYDIIAQAMTGLMASENRIEDGVPQQIQSSPVADFATGIAMAWSVTSALYHRERTGKGQFVETTLMTTALALQSYSFLQVDALESDTVNEFVETLGLLRGSGTNYEQISEYHRNTFEVGRPAIGNPYYRTYQAFDGVIAVGCLSDPLKRKMCSVLGVSDPRLEPTNTYDIEDSAKLASELSQVMEANFKTRSVSDWLGDFDDVGVPAGPVRFVQELLTDEQVLSNNMITNLEHSQIGSINMVGPLVKMSDSPLEAKIASPSLGEHTNEILTAMGISDEEIQKLREDNVIS